MSNPQTLAPDTQQHEFHHVHMSYTTYTCLTPQPDVVILSRSTKTVIMLELTVPLEDRSHLAFDRKSSKYSAVVTACEESGFNAHLFPIEVGCLGCSPHSLFHCLEALGLPKSTARQLHTECSRVAQRCSYIIFLGHGIKPWQEMSHLYYIDPLALPPLAVYT